MFETVNNMFTKLEKVYENLYCKKYIKEKFKELKMDIKSFNSYYSKFIYLTTKLEFTKEMLL